MDVARIPLPAWQLQGAVQRCCCLSLYLLPSSAPGWGSSPGGCPCTAPCTKDTYMRVGLIQVLWRLAWINDNDNECHSPSSTERHLWTRAGWLTWMQQRSCSCPAGAWGSAGDLREHGKHRLPGHPSSAQDILALVPTCLRDAAHRQLDVRSRGLQRVTRTRQVMSATQLGRVVSLSRLAASTPAAFHARFIMRLFQQQVSAQQAQHLAVRTADTRMSAP
jgi:hypothetical protein